MYFSLDFFSPKEMSQEGGSQLSDSEKKFEQLLHNSQTLVELFLLLSLNVIEIQVV